MLLSRFWYLLLAVAAGLLVTVIAMAQSAFGRQLDRNLEEQLRRDRYELELVLKNLAREQIDAISGVAAHADVKKSLRAAATSRDAGVTQREALSRRLQILNEQLDEYAGDLLFAVGSDGTIVGAVGAEKLHPKASLRSYPLVKRALGGFLRDDAWLWNDSIYRMAARPVVDGGQYIGAVVHGMKVNGEFTKRLSTRVPGATIGFFVGDQIVASHMAPSSGTSRAEDLAAPLAEALDNPNLRNGDPTQAINVASGRAKAVYSLITGSAAQANVGYALSRPTRSKGEGSLLQYLDFQKDGGTGTFFAVGLPIVLLGFLVSMGFMFLEHDRPTRRLVAQTAALAEGSVNHLDASQFGGRYRKAAEATNRALERVSETGGMAKPADLNEVLGAGQSAAAPSFFGFANREDGISSEIPPPPPPSEPDGAAVGPSDNPPPAFHPPVPPAPAEAEATVSNQESGPHNSSVIRTPVAPAPAENSAWAAAGGNMVTPPPPPPGRGSTGPSSLGSIPTIGGEFQEEEGQTLVKQIPQELLDAVSSGGQAVQDSEEAHFHEVFDEFVRTKQQCGENTTGLTFDKFRRTLEKNKRQIVARHGASRVRFTVYVKAGRAALKATPIK